MRPSAGKAAGWRDAAAISRCQPVSRRTALAASMPSRRHCRIGFIARRQPLSLKIDTMPSIAIRPLHRRPGHWRRFAMRGVKTWAAALVIAICIWALARHDFGTTIVYSLCISTLCWLFIDLGRDLVARRTAIPLPGTSSVGGGWPGWVWMLVIVAVGAVLGYAVGTEIANRLTGLNLPGPFNAGFRDTLSLLVLALLPAIVITHFFHSREVIADQKAEVETAQRQAAEQQLKLLESQLEPHMLFNTLANLRVLIGVDAARAQQMLDQLIAFLRASLAGSRTGLHSLAEEFARLHDYLALMQVRMGTRLVTHFELPAELAGAQLPPLLLQPLVENSIKHGLEPHVAGGRVAIGAAREGDLLVLRVRDSGAGLGEVAGNGVGYGLAHVRERLATLYGARASFSLAPAADAEGGTLATIRLPLEVAPGAVLEPRS